MAEALRLAAEEADEADGGRVARPGRALFLGWAPRPMRLQLRRASRSISRIAPHVTARTPAAHKGQIWSAPLSSFMTKKMKRSDQSSNPVARRPECQLFLSFPRTTFTTSRNT